MIQTEFRLAHNPKKEKLSLHWENYISISFHIEWDMIVVTVFEPNGISIWFKNYHHDHIPFIVKGNENIVFSVQDPFNHFYIFCIITPAHGAQSLKGIEPCEVWYSQHFLG